MNLNIKTFKHVNKTNYKTNICKYVFQAGWWNQATTTFS